MGAARQATYADLEAVPEHLVAEIVDGELLTHPRPAPRHVIAAFALNRALVDTIAFPLSNHRPLSSSERQQDPFIGDR